MTGTGVVPADGTTSHSEAPRSFTISVEPCRRIRPVPITVVVHRLRERVSARTPASRRCLRRKVHNHGLAGVLTDSRLRDFDELARYQFATWCAGEATRWGGDTVAPYAANIPVEVGGVCITPGDYIYADGGGAVVIPAASLNDVLVEARRIEAADQQVLAQIRDEDPAALRAGTRYSTEA